MKKIFIHIGLPKTGSSYLQSAFAINSKLYHKHNLIYSNLEGEDNFENARMGVTTSGNGVRIAAASGIEALRNIKAYDLNDLFSTFELDFNHLISSEWLIGCSIDFLKNIQYINKEKFECKFIAFIRNPIDRIKSLYLQNIKNGNYREGLEHHIHELILKEGERLDKIIELGNNVVLINYDKSRDNLLQEIDNILFGYELSIAPKFSFVNPSPTLKQAELIRLANNMGLNDFNKVMIYLENANKNLSFKERYPITSKLQQLIIDELSEKIYAINKLLPKNKVTMEINEEISDNSFKLLLTDDDIDFMRNLFTVKQSLLTDDIKFIRSAMNLKFHPNLPKDFDPCLYLFLNEDVLRARVDPIHHFLYYGVNENRRYK